MDNAPDRATLARLLDVYDSFAEESDLPSVGDADFLMAGEERHNAIVDSGYRAVIKDGNIYLPDFHGLPGEAILVDPAEPEDLADPEVLNLDEGRSSPLGTWKAIPMARTKRQPGDEPPVPATVRPAYEAVVGRTDAFCRGHLDAEYEALCR